jgi:hypothetical protein
MFTIIAKADAAPICIQPIEPPVRSFADTDRQPSAMRATYTLLSNMIMGEEAAL